MADAEKTKTDTAAAPAPAKGGVMDKVNEFLDRPVATIGDAIEKITHTGAHAADAKVDPAAPASGSPKVVEGEVVKPPPCPRPRRAASWTRSTSSSTAPWPRSATRLKK